MPAESAGMREYAHLFHIPDTRGGVDVLAQLLADLFDRLSNNHDGAAHEVQASGVVVLGDAAEKGAY